MSIYNNFLNTFYKPYNNTIVFANIRNYCEEKGAFIVYCDPEYIPFSYLPAFLNWYDCNSYKKYLPFRTKRLSGKKINLYLVFNALKTYLHDNICADRKTALIDIQKFFFPYYENINVKTVYSNVLTYDNFISELNLLYETTEPITPENLPCLECLIVKDCCPEDLKIEINYDLYCPFFKYPIRFVFQYFFQFHCENITI